MQSIAKLQTQEVAPHQTLASPRRFKMRQSPAIKRFKICQTCNVSIWTQQLNTMTEGWQEGSQFETFKCQMRKEGCVKIQMCSFCDIVGSLLIRSKECTVSGVAGGRRAAMPRGTTCWKPWCSNPPGSPTCFKQPSRFSISTF